MTVKTNLCILYILSLCLIHPPGALSQPIPSDSTSYNARSAAIAASGREIGNNLRLYTGSEYVRNGLKAQGYPFFQSDTTLTGSLDYDGAFYDNIPLQYDLVSDELFINDTINNVSISLVKDKLARFTISGHTFISLQTDSATGMDNHKFYEVLCDAPYPLYARHDKKLIFPTNREDVIKYTSTDQYFLRLHDQYLRIEGQRSLLNVLSDKKDELKRYIHQSKPDFRHDPANAYAMVVNYYTQLKK